MNDRDLASVKKFAEELKGDFVITFFSGIEKGSDKRSEEFETFLDELSSLSSVKVNKENKGSYPSFFIKKNLEYLAIPSDKELSPFLDEILLQKEGRNIPDGLKDKILALQDTVNIDLYISNFCPTCPYTVRQMMAATDYSDKIHLRVIDSILFSELAEKENIMSVPTVLVNGMRWTGEIKFSEILDFISGASFDKMSSDAIGRLLKDGKASYVSKVMLEKNELYPSFLSLLRDEKWSVRLGAIVVMEEISEASRDLARESVPFLLSDFENQSDQVKGDIIYVLGLSGGPEIIPELTRIVETTENEELKSAAEEAVIEIEQHFS